MIGRAASPGTGARGHVYRRPDLDVSTFGYPTITLHGGWAGAVHVQGRLVGEQSFGSQADALEAVCAELRRRYDARWRPIGARP